jgi:hypothetical protein
MDNYILFQMHIMWYESKMLNETLDSIQQAMQYSELPVKVKLCINSQTYLETPVTGNSVDMIKEFENHPLLENSQIIYKTDSDDFYNIGDWRREVYDIDAKYTVWGESDCLLPEDFFYILSTVQIDELHSLTFSSRKMWDTTWDIVEHIDLHKYPRSIENVYQAPHSLNSCDVITQSELDAFNNQFDINIIKLPNTKIDGSLLCLSNGLNLQLIPEDMHFVREDFCAEQVLGLKNIPQYHVSTRIKGHNYGHPLKRTNTNATRDSNLFKSYESQSQLAMQKFLANIQYNN